MNSTETKSGAVNQSKANMRNSNKKTSIAILGAGLMGRMLALSLTQPDTQLNNVNRCHEYAVTLFDKDTLQGSKSAAYLAAAMLTPLSESAEASENVMQMGEHALSLWPKFLAQLREPVFFQQQGSIILAHEQDRSYLNDFKRRLKKQAGSYLQELAIQDIGKLEPALQNQAKRFASALYLPKEGQLDNRQLLKSMASTLQQRKVNWQTETDIDFVKYPELLKQLKEEFDWVIDCRGLGAKADIASIKHTQTEPPQSHRLRGVRGEVMRVHAPEVNIQRPVRLMHPRYPIYIAPKENQHFVIGATQIESEDQRQPTVRSSLELLSSCFSVHPGFAEAEVLEMRAGLRPALTDNEPKIWQSDNYIMANGLYRHGYLLAPTIVEQCLAMIQGHAESQPFFNHLVIANNFTNPHLSLQTLATRSSVNELAGLSSAEQQNYG